MEQSSGFANTRHSVGAVTRAVANYGIVSEEAYCRSSPYKPISSAAPLNNHKQNFCAVSIRVHYTVIWGSLTEACAKSRLSEYLGVAISDEKIVRSLPLNPILS